MEHRYNLEYDNLMLRPVRNDDIEKLRQWRNKKSIREKFIYSDEISKDAQQRWYEAYLEKQGDLMFIITEMDYLKKDVGAIALYNIDKESSTAEYGRVMIGEEDAMSKGIAKNASLAIIQFAFEVLKLDMVYLEVFSDNHNAVMMYKKVGFDITDEKEDSSGAKLYIMQIHNQSKGGKND